MIQVCDPPRQRQVRRLSAEEFCLLARREVSSIYRPYSEVLRMLAVGEVWGVCAARSVPQAALLVLPLDADTAAAAALRACMGWRSVAGGYFLTPPVGAANSPELVCAAAARAEYLARGRTVRAVLECTAQAQELLPLYLKQGFALRALRPLDSLAPCFVLTAGAAAPPVHAVPVWVPLEDRAHLALLLAKGYAALDSRPYQHGQGIVLAMYPQ